MLAKEGEGNAIAGGPEPAGTSVAAVAAYAESAAQGAGKADVDGGEVIVPASRSEGTASEAAATAASSSFAGDTTSSPTTASASFAAIDSDTPHSPSTSSPRSFVSPPSASDGPRDPPPSVSSNPDIFKIQNR